MIYEGYPAKRDTYAYPYVKHMEAILVTGIYVLLIYQGYPGKQDTYTYPYIMHMKALLETLIYK